MIDFEYQVKTKLYFGKDKENEIGHILSSLNVKNVLLVYGKSSIKQNGLYDKIINYISNENIAIYELSGIRANPSIESVKQGVKIARENNCDFILAVGGGSVIDAAKSIAVSYFYDGDPFDFNLHKINPEKALGVGVILTLAASGSEMSTSCVISNDALGIKQRLNSELVRPLFAILNPKLTYSVSPYQTGCGIVDIISHSLERYFSPSHNDEFSDDYALTLIKQTIESGRKCLQNPNDYDARAMMMLDGTYSHNGFTSLGKKYTMVIHALEHAVSGYKNDIAHGAGLSVLIPMWMNYVYLCDIDKFDKFARNVFNLSFDNKIENAKMGIISLKNYFKEIKMPTTLKELGLNDDDLEVIANRLTNNGTRLIGQTSIKTLSREDILKMFDSAFEEEEK